MSKVRTELEVPEELLNEFDNAIKGHYANRSEALRASMRLLIDKLNEGKVEGKLLRGLEEFLTTRLPKPEDKESVKKAEVERFTRKWGTPAIMSLRTQPPYVQLKTIETVKSEDAEITLKILNDVLLNCTPIVDEKRTKLSEFDAEKWKNVAFGKLSYIVDYFKSKGFTVGECRLDSPYSLIWTYVTDGDKEAAKEFYDRSIHGLFAFDNEDIVFIAYREVKSK